MQQWKERSRQEKGMLMVKISAGILLGIFLLSRLAYLIYQVWMYDRLGNVNVSVKIIDDLANGINPYSTDWLYDADALPMPYYESGFFHLLPAALFAGLTGISAGAASGITQILYVVLALLVMFLCIKNLTGDTLWGLLGISVYFECTRPYLVDCFRPDTLCSLLIVTIFLILIKDNLPLQKEPVGSGRQNGKEWLVTFLCVLLLFLKVHYASIIAALFFVYLKRKRIFPVLLKGAVWLALVTIWTRICFPTFFSTFFVRVIEMMRDNNADSDLAYMFDQWKTLLCKFWPMFLLLLAGGIFHRKDFRLLWKNEMALLLGMDLLVNAAALCYMGKWNGNYISYHYIMLMPAVILTAMFFLAEFARKKDFMMWILLAATLLYSGVSAWQGTTEMVSKIASRQETIDNRERMNAFFDRYLSGDMLLDPSHSYYAYNHNLYQWDYMDQIYIPYDIGSSPRWNFLFPYTNLYRSRCISYAETMLDKIKKQKYSIIIEDDIHILGLKLGLENEFRDAIRKYYVEQTEDGLTYWVPDNRSDGKDSTESFSHCVWNGA